MREPPKVVLFTSAVPEEGKTALSLSFGRFVALVNRSCVVVDCDLRRSSVHQYLRGHRTPGLVDCLLVPQLFNARRFGVALDAFPHLTAIEARCLALPAFARTAPDQVPDAE